MVKINWRLRNEYDETDRVTDYVDSIVDIILAKDKGEIPDDANEDLLTEIRLAEDVYELDI